MNRGRLAGWYRADRVRWSNRLNRLEDVAGRALSVSVEDAPCHRYNYVAHSTSIQPQKLPLSSTCALDLILIPCVELKILENAVEMSQIDLYIEAVVTVYLESQLKHLPRLARLGHVQTKHTTPMWFPSQSTSTKQQPHHPGSASQGEEDPTR